MNIPILCFAARRIATWKMNLKDTLITGLMLLIGLYFIGKGLNESSIYPLVQLGCVNRLEMIRNSKILIPVGTTALHIGFVIAAVTCGATIWYDFGRKGRKSRKFRLMIN